MRILHLSDLHIGKTVNQISMLDEQEHILRQILDLVPKCNIDAVLIAGDVYDRGVPSVDAVRLFDDFLCRLGDTGREIFIIGGNHDSAERLTFASTLLDRLNIHIYSLYDGTVHSYDMHDEYGTVRFFLVPFVKPAIVRTYFEDMEIKNYDGAFRAVLSKVKLDLAVRNVAVAHQYITNGGFSPLRCDSETETIGGLDNIDASVFDDFDYVALGHLHRSQKIRRETVRYCGSPLKYSVSEAIGKKSAIIIDMKEKGNISIEKMELKPLHDMRRIEGRLEQLISSGVDERSEDYIFAVLTDEAEPLEPATRLRSVYKNLMGVEYKRALERVDTSRETESKINMNPMNLLEEFYERQNGSPMDNVQKDAVTKIFRNLTDGGIDGI